MKIGFNFDNSYTKLPDSIFLKIVPTKFKEPKLIILNEELAKKAKPKKTLLNG